MSLEQLPIHLERLDEGNGIEMAMVVNMQCLIPSIMQASIQQYKVAMSREKNTKSRWRR